MKHIFSHCGVLFFPCLSLLQGRSILTDASAPTEAMPLLHLVVLYQLSSLPSCCLKYSPYSPLIVNIHPLLFSIFFFKQISPSFTCPYQPYIWYPTHSSPTSIHLHRVLWFVVVVRLYGVDSFKIYFKITWLGYTFLLSPTPDRISSTDIPHSHIPFSFCNETWYVFCWWWGFFCGFVLFCFPQHEYINIWHYSWGIAARSRPEKDLQGQQDRLRLLVLLWDATYTSSFTC